jgi:peptidyl-prolyl cis-trans isomerase C
MLRRVITYHIVLMVVSLMAMSFPAGAEDAKPQPANKAAMVNGSPIEKAEFDEAVLKIQRRLLEFGRPLTAQQVVSVQMDVLESLVRLEILHQEGRKAGIKSDENAIDKEIETFKKQFANETEFKNELSRSNISEEILRSRLERNSAVQQYIERNFSAKVEVPDNDMVAYYESRLDLFKQSQQVRVSHILIHSDPQWEASRKQEARSKAEQILKGLKKGEDFAALARSQSDGPTRTSGGDLGYIKTGQLEKQLESVVSSLKPGETSEIVETDYGFHLFRVFDRKPETILAYDSVKEQIRQLLRMEKAKQEADLYAKSLREKAAVEILLKDEISFAKQL